MGKLDVNLPDLSRVAGGYAELQTAAAAISPQAADEVQRIIDTHGPMGYPVAVGVVAGLARRQGPLEAKAADFGKYSERFQEHIATYSSADREAARRFDAPMSPGGVHTPTICDVAGRSSLPALQRGNRTRMSHFPRGFFNQRDRGIEHRRRPTPPTID